MDLVKFLKSLNNMKISEKSATTRSIKKNILYDNSRELKQWSVDRINNDFGHNNDNFYLACLDCNLQRRRKSDTKFLFTKQLCIIKQE